MIMKAIINLVIKKFIKYFKHQMPVVDSTIIILSCYFNNLNQL